MSPDRQATHVDWAGPSHYERAIAARHLAECRRLLGRSGPLADDRAEGPRFTVQPVKAPCQHLVLAWGELTGALPHHHAADEECPRCHDGFRSRLPPRQYLPEATS